MTASIMYKKKSEGNVSMAIQGNELKIGRTIDNDIVIDDDREVSGKHARILFKDNKYFIEDLKSTNGTKVNNKPLGEVIELKNNDKIKIGQMELTFISISSSSLPSFSHTFLNLTAPGTLKNSPLKEHLLKDRQTIGRDPDSDIPLEHILASWKHAEIENTKNGYILKDCGSTNGTFLNGQRVSGSIPLNVNDIIQIGPFKLMFDGEKLARLSEQGNIRLDVADLTVIRGKNKKILNGVNLSINPRDFIAIVGPSGAGKSTLLKSLCGAVFAEEGEVRVNGIDFYDSFDAFRSMLGYVPQDDIIHKNLTVRKALKYSGEMRLPDDTTEEELDSVINDTLLKLEMSEHSEKGISSLSGGQRKRVSIGVEMLTNPSLFFLDEPTSGLDPSTERNLMHLMKERSEKDGKTIILVTHVTKNVDLCDRIIVMGTGGYLTFYGTPSEALKFFEVNDFTDIYDKVNSLEETKSISEKFYQSQYYINYIHNPLKEVGLAESTKPVMNEVKAKMPEQQNSTSSFRQFTILLRRYWEIKTGDLTHTLLTTAMLAGVCILLSIIFDRTVLEVNEENFGDATKLVFFLCCIALWFGSSGASLEIINELPVYLRERMVNLRIIPYVLSKVIVLGVTGLIQTLVMTLVLLIFFKDIPHSPGKLVIFSASIFITYLTSICLGLLISACVKSSEKASTILPVALVIQIILAGAIVPLNAMHSLCRLLSFIIPGRWGFTIIGEALRLDEMLDLSPEAYEKIYGDFAGSFGDKLIPYGNDIVYAAGSLIVLSIIFLAICCLALWEKESRRVEYI